MKIARSTGEMQPPSCIQCMPSYSMYLSITPLYPHCFIKGIHIKNLQNKISGLQDLIASAHINQNYFLVFSKYSEILLPISLRETQIFSFSTPLEIQPSKDQNKTRIEKETANPTFLRYLLCAVLGAFCMICSAQRGYAMGVIIPIFSSLLDFVWSY